MLNRFISLSLLIIVSNDVISQGRIGVIVGPQATSANYKVDNKKQPTEYKLGAQGGITLKIPFENQLYFAPSFYYSLKGYKVKLNKPSYPPGEDAISNNVSVHIIEVAPLFHFDLSKNAAHPFIQFGPAIDIILYGKEKIALKNGDEVSRNMKFSFADYGRIAASAIARLGYQLQNEFFFFGHITYGIGSMNNADNGPKILHRVYGISVGKYLGGKRQMN
ncbi:MAG: porin family protein [Chitinophagaceae bacterium]